MKAAICVVLALTPLMPSALQVASDKTTQKTDKSLGIEFTADGCQHIFLDVGAKHGVHTRTLFESSKYPKSKHYWETAAQKGRAFEHYRNIFRKGGAATDANSASTCAFGFEANPAFTHRLQALSKSYVYQGRNVQFFPWAASDQDGKMSLSTGANKTIEVNTIDLAKFIEDHMIHRHLPNDKEWRSIVMKMDIDGAEYAVLSRLLQRGLLCKETGIEAITTKFHGDGAEDKCPPEAKNWGNCDHAMWLKAQVAFQDGCTGTDIIDLVDKDYADDAQPLVDGSAAPAI